MNLLRKLRALFRREKLDAEMSEEMRFHLELQARENRAKGMSREEAGYAARRQFGGVEQIKEHARAQRGFAWLEHFIQDLRFGFRSLAKARSFTAVAAAVLALGIGLNTSLFSVVYAVFFDPYPYARPQEIWVPKFSALNRAVGMNGMRIGEYLALSDLPAIAHAMAANPQQANLGGGTNPEVLRTVQMSATAFDFLGVAPMLGRTITAADLQPNGEARPVAVLSFQLWQRRFNGSPEVLEQTVTLNDVPHTIIGVMPPRFNWYTTDGLWLPQATVQRQSGTNPLIRLKAGFTKEVAEQQIYAQLLEVQQKMPNRFPKDGFRVRLENFSETAASGARSNLKLLMLAVAFLLVITCTNVANLQLARAAMRGREIAIRLALGASRGRVIRQLLTENLVLSALGGTLGALLAFWLTRLFVLLLPSAYLPREARVELNGVALGFCAGIAVVTGIVFGLVPAIQCSRPKLNEALKSGGHAVAASGGSRRTRDGLVMAQVGLSVLLLIGAMLTVRGFVRQRFFESGFEPERTLMFRVPLTPATYRTPVQRNAFTRELIERVERLPGVAAVAAGTLPGMEGTAIYSIPGKMVPDGARITINALSHRYLEALGIPLLAGRKLTEQEIEWGEPVALINASGAKLWGGSEAALGQVIQFNLGASLRPGARTTTNPDGKRDVTIVGVIGDIHKNGLDPNVASGVFVPFTVRGGNERLLMVRAREEPLPLLNSVRRELRTLDPTQPLDQPVTWQELLDTATEAPRFNMALLNVLALVALFLTSAGIYSVLSYSVVERTRELGVRLALGAARRDIVTLILREGGRLVLAGLALGLVASAIVARLIRSEWFAVPLLDPLALIAALVALSLVGVLACFIPARRASKIDPMVALRCE